MLLISSCKYALYKLVNYYYYCYIIIIVIIIIIFIIIIIIIIIKETRLAFFHINTYFDVIDVYKKDESS